MISGTRVVPDTRDMIVVHRAFRREARALPGLVAAVRPGDVARARLLAEHLDDCTLGLHLHHSGEDELLWPLLLRRVDLEAELVLSMESQHQEISAVFTRITDLLPRWRETAGERERDALAAALTEAAALLTEHLDQEEKEILPLVEQHLTSAEWERLGEHFGEGLPRQKMLFFMGSLLEEATPEEQALFLAKIPLPGKALWYLLGRGAYRRRVARVRAAG